MRLHVIRVRRNGSRVVMRVCAIRSLYGERMKVRALLPGNSSGCLSTSGVHTLRGDPRRRECRSKMLRPHVRTLVMSRGKNRRALRVGGQQKSRRIGLEKMFFDLPSPKQSARETVRSALLTF